MLREIMCAEGISPSNTIMVGDSDTDRQAAQSAGCNFVWAAEFFSW